MDEGRVKAVFVEALELPPGDRGAYLDRACAGDAPLRARVESLLASAERDDAFLGADVEMSRVEGRLGAERPGEWIGPYRLVRELGEGGFGRVFEAEQREPVARRVAIKIIKLGMDTRAVVGRFEQERQALALMDHPNIAKVLDAGSTPGGRPYFVMELVEGIPITAYADGRRLGIAARLRLFTQVCRAIQHAHTKGIIHRDIKPGNILVVERDGAPMARVIDFGIAKATRQREAERTAFTQERQLIGTPVYMSPEQAAGSPDIDTRTDVYSLGVLLYELLTGATPFDGSSLRSAAYGEIERIIREVDPVKPSTRVSRAGDVLAASAANRGVEARRLETTLRGELDWIAMKALEKDRGRRYDSAGALAEDVERYLAGGAVEAAPPSRAYRARKFARRHRGLILSTGAVVAALALGLASTAIALGRATRDRDRAVVAERATAEHLEQIEREKKKTEQFARIASQVSDFFLLDILNVKPLAPGEKEPTVTDLLERVPAQIDAFYKADPAVEGMIRERVGQIYLNMGRTERARPYLEAAIPLLESSLGPDASNTISAQRRLALMLEDLEEYASAEAMYDRVHQARMRLRGVTHEFTWTSLVDRGRARALAGRVDEGLADVDRGFETLLGMGPATHRTNLGIRSSRARTYADAGRFERALELAREGIDLVRSAPKDVAPFEWEFRVTMGVALEGLDRPAEALGELDAAIERFTALLPPDHETLFDARVERARALARLGRWVEARRELEACHAHYAAFQGPTSRITRRLAGSLAEACDALGDDPGAAEWRARATSP